MNTAMNTAVSTAVQNSVRPVAVHHPDPDQGPHRIVLAMVAVILLFIIVAVGWASYAQLDVAAQGRGAVVPPSRLQEVQSLEGGIVQELLVGIGDKVKVGQVLARLDLVAHAHQHLLHDAAFQALHLLQPAWRHHRAAALGRHVELGIGGPGHRNDDEQQDHRHHRQHDAVRALVGVGMVHRHRAHAVLDFGADGRVHQAAPLLAARRRWASTAAALSPSSSWLRWVISALST